MKLILEEQIQACRRTVYNDTENEYGTEKDFITAILNDDAIPADSEILTETATLVNGTQIIYKKDGLEESTVYDASTIKPIDNVRDHNIGASDYSKHKIQPWDIWMEYHLNPWDADIVKRILRTKETDTRKMDYEKIIHICQERIRQIDSGYQF